MVRNPPDGGDEIFWSLFIQELELPHLQTIDSRITSDGSGFHTFRHVCNLCLSVADPVCVPQKRTHSQPTEVCSSFYHSHFITSK